MNMLTHQNNTKRSMTWRAVKYCALPGIWPRLKRLFGEGFGFLTMSLAQVFFTARLLPAHHPYLQAEHVGRYTVYSVCAEARKHLGPLRQNYDRHFVFYTLLFGLFLFLFQFGLFAFSALTSSVFAQSTGFPAEWAAYFVTARPEQDIAFQLLDYTFGIPGMFGSNAAPANAASIPAFQNALHLLFSFYNTGILMVGGVILFYLIVTTVAETARTGSPFGQRFNRGIAPLRIIFAFALMIPFSLGFNGAQWIGLQAAKLGSSMATNGYIGFMCSFTTVAPDPACPTAASSSGGVFTPAGVPQDLVLYPTTPDINALFEFGFIYHTCRHMQKFLYGRDIQTYLVKDDLHILLESGVTTSEAPFTINVLDINPAPDYNDALTFAGFDAVSNEHNTIRVRFGVHDSSLYKNQEGHVYPFCGEVTLSPGEIGLETDGSGNIIETGAFVATEAMYNTLVFLAYDEFFREDAELLARSIVPTADRFGASGISEFAELEAKLDMNVFDISYFNYYNGLMEDLVEAAYQAQVNNPEWIELITERGWGGAAIWYNKIAELNGGFISAVYNVPRVTQYPSAMEWIKQYKQSNTQAVSVEDMYRPVMPSGDAVQFPAKEDEYMAIALYAAEQMWQGLEPTTEKSNIISQSIISLFGLQGLYDQQENQTTYPLAQLAGIGRGLVDSAVASFGMAAGGGLLSLLASAETGFGSITRTATSFASKIGSLGLALGFVLFYVIPFLPFMYYFFAVSEWVKSIFEAMVGLPLWALAHLRIDGEGIPGPTGMNGYFLLFEIFLRPILIFFAFLASISIYAAQINILNEVWKTASENIMGTNPEDSGLAELIRAPLDDFFLMVIYAIIAYLLATASFKLIDLIPNYILRWMNASVATFGEQAGQPVENLIRYAFIGAQSVESRLSRTDDIFSRI